MNTHQLGKKVEEYGAYMTAGAEILSKIIADKPWLDDFAKADLEKNIKNIEKVRDVYLPALLQKHCTDQISEATFLFEIERKLEQVNLAVEQMTQIFDMIKPHKYYDLGDLRFYHPSTDYNSQGVA